ncbi:MAG TPA: transglutaminase family protein [Acidobacteriaceae bacterium]|nr:transglutaminase family protein [Acidobacteriaceae bacterium]
MLIQSAFDIQFELDRPTPVVAMLHLHPSLAPRVRAGDRLVVEHEHPGIAHGFGHRLVLSDYADSFGNRCSRLLSPPGRLRLSGSNVVEIEDDPDPVAPDAQQAPIQRLPSEVLQFLLPSRYCEVDRFVQIAHDLFGDVPQGWTRAAAIRDWVHEKVRFDYSAARPTKTAMDVFTERVGVCRDFQHLAVTLCRSLNIPARYATGYLGDIRHAYSGPGDFSAWYQVWLDDRWWTMDARHNEPRYGRVLMATGRDAADVAITTSFGNAELKHFWVESNEVDLVGTRRGTASHLASLAG